MNGGEKVGASEVCPRCGLGFIEHGYFFDPPEGEMAVVAADHESPVFGYCPTIGDDERYQRLLEERKWRS